MRDRLKRAANNSLWGNLDESARVAREQAEAERVARDEKTRRLGELRLSVASHEGPAHATR
jgi:hypothetical protein